MNEKALEELLEKTELLCARCALLHREIAHLTQENKKLRHKREIAKDKLRDLLRRLPEYEE